MTSRSLIGCSSQTEVSGKTWETLDRPAGRPWQTVAHRPPWDTSGQPFDSISGGWAALPASDASSGTVARGSTGTEALHRSPRLDRPAGTDQGCRCGVETRWGRWCRNGWASARSATTTNCQLSDGWSRSFHADMPRWHSHSMMIVIYMQMKSIDLRYWFNWLTLLSS